VFCKTCPVGSTSSMGASTINQCYCSAGFYGTPGNCRPCPNLGRLGEIGAWTYCVVGPHKIFLLFQFQITKHDAGHYAYKSQNHFYKCPRTCRNSPEYFGVERV